jgi:hypothetical protein
MSVDILVVMKDENRNFQPTLWLSSAMRISRDMSQVGVALFYTL